MRLKSLGIAIFGELHNHLSCRSHRRSHAFQYSTVTSEIGFRLEHAQKLFSPFAKALVCKANPHVVTRLDSYNARIMESNRTLLYVTNLSCAIEISG
jgi:hypothetical protein